MDRIRAYNGSIIGVANSATVTTASGIWMLNETFIAVKGNNWPVAAGGTNPNITVEYLVIGGGGSGGANVGGGGGAGGLATGTNLTLTGGQSYTVTVGAGGARGMEWAFSGYRGNSSTVATIVGKAGGAGRSISTRTGEQTDVGCSGGHWNPPATPNEATQGFNGGRATAGTSSANYNGGGGGSAGAGGNGIVNSRGGTGGLGTTSTITGTAIEVGGGGGGSSDARASAGRNGGTASHGATAGGKGTTTSDASVNTGAGSGGCGYIGTGANGSPFSGAGGSGVVIFRYANTNATLAATTGSPTYTNTGGNHVYVFTQSGSFTV